MRIDNDITAARLPENLGKFYRMKTPGFNDIPKDTSRSYTRKLVGITYQNQPRPRCDCFQQGIHERDIHHRHLIHNNRICLKRILLIALKSGAPSINAPVQFEHPVNRPRLKTGCLTHTLCRASGRCSQKNVHTLHFKIADDCIDRGCLTGSRSTCNNQQSIADSFLDRLHLMFVQIHFCLFFDFAYLRFDFNLRYIIAHIKLLQHGCRIGLHIIEAGRVDVRLLPLLLQHNLAVHRHIHVQVFYLLRLYPK